MSPPRARSWSTPGWSPTTPPYGGSLRGPARAQRFLEEEAEVEPIGNDFRYLPLGAGRWSCPRIVLALPIIGKSGQFSLRIMMHSTAVCKPTVSRPQVGYVSALKQTPWWWADAVGPQPIKRQCSAELTSISTPEMRPRLRPDPVHLGLLLGLLLLCHRAGASIHEYYNGAFIPRSNSFFFHGGSEGLYASAEVNITAPASDGNSFIQ
ncbi:hypothetical protein BHE74_00003291 [Ensete ventricosum]|nr:hypothetical protein GW17_00010513 [Ensete ventricosum]RWW87874.1 hypothetical protein BHE74_00003291 [Ensete ventricosum]RZR80652.1 hypothetical protein BHM03_00006707 [Ensete ventricosum]